MHQPAYSRLLALLLATSSVAQAQEPVKKSADEGQQVQSLAISASVSFETVKLNANEKMGLLGTSLLFETTPGWWVGPGVYGAATGQRGGFFVGGAEAQYRFRLAPRVLASTGVFVGGGGGGGAAVGGGLMLRPALSLMFDWGGFQTGISLSSVQFPNGHIRSNQAGLVMAFDERFVHQDWRLSGQRIFMAERSGLGFDRLALTLGSYRPRATSWPQAGPASSGSIATVGARGDHWISPSLYWGIEAAGAAHGGADGYAEALGTLGWEQSMASIGLNSVSLGARASLGLGGGGAVATGGGVIGKAAATLNWNVSRGYFVGIESGRAAAVDGHFNARYSQVLLGMTLDHPFIRPNTSGDAAVTRNEWALSLQHVMRAARKTGGEPSLDTVGFKLNRYLNEHFYLSAQAHSAFAGGAGAYSIGLVGAGVCGAAPITGWSLGAELLAGAAGGGGVDTQGGAIAQALAYLGWRASKDGEVKFGLGRVASVRGTLGSPLLELAWSQSFGLAGR